MPGTIHEFDLDQTTTIAVNASGDTWHLAAGTSIDADGYGMNELATVSGNSMLIDGFLISDLGLQSYGNGSSIHIGTSGTVFGFSSGLKLGGNDQVLVNYGAVLSKTIAILVNQGENRIIDNYGAISGKFGLAGTGDKLAFHNHAGASVFGSTNGINLDTPNAWSWTIVNEGNIKGENYAVHLNSAGNNVLTNTGVITGDIVYGSGNDLLDTSGGTIGGNVFMGGGDDIVKAVKASLVTIFHLDDGDDQINLMGATGDITAKGGAGDDVFQISGKNQLLVENVNEGIDTVLSTASFTLGDNFENLTLLGKAKRNATGNELDNVLTGNNGKNTIKGMAGDDTISGGRGADKLIGGDGADHFIFANKSGHDRIMDFKPGEDSIDLSGLSAITSFSDLKQHHMTASHGDVIISAGKDVLVLDGVKIGQLHSGDFDF